VDSSAPSGTARVFALYIYPLKGARGIALDRSDVLATGLRHDRRFMGLDAHGTFLTQREHPRLALLETAIEDDHLVLRIHGTTDRARISLRAEDHAHRPRRHALVWKDEVHAIDVGGEGAELLSDHLREACSLLFMPPDTIRPVDPAYAREGDRVGFADAFPVLIASLASLADLNARLESSVGIDRFRANVVITGNEPWAEEAATRIQIGAVSFRTPKKCARCVVVTTDQHTGDVGKEPLRTLATFRREGNKVNFAMNAIPDLDESASIAIGDAVVLS
jgi:uncharacterized protein YcbX